MWEHPARVYEFLKKLEWPTKKEDIERFVRAYPNSISNPPSLTPADYNANLMIKGFWAAFGEVRKEMIAKGEFEERDDIWILEGHRPVEQYMMEMQRAGYSLDTHLIRDLQNQGAIRSNPHQILPDSRLLMVTIGQKLL